MSDLQNAIESAFERRAEINPHNVDAPTREAVHEAIHLLDCGQARVAEKLDGDWVVNQPLRPVLKPRLRPYVEQEALYVT